MGLFKNLMNKIFRAGGNAEAPPDAFKPGQSSTESRVEAAQRQGVPLAVAQQDDASRTERDARRDCMRYTGSRITARRADREARADVDSDEKIDRLDRDGCVAANGRVYSREDLRRTGEVDIADALRKLDPAIR